MQTFRFDRIILKNFPQDIKIGKVWHFRFMIFRLYKNFYPMARDFIQISETTKIRRAGVSVLLHITKERGILSHSIFPSPFHGSTLIFGLSSTLHFASHQRRPDGRPQTPRRGRLPGLV